VLTFYVLTIFVKGNTFFNFWVLKILIIYQQFIINERVGKKSMCVAAKGRLQGRAATLLLLCGGIFLFSIFLLQQNSIFSLSLFFLGLLVTYLSISIFDMRQTKMGCFVYL